MIGDRDGILKVEACGLCGTDHEQFLGVLPSRCPLIPGHETVGIIEEIGPEAGDRLQVKPGDRVAVEVFQSCGKCKNCVVGDYRKCREHGIGDMYGFISASKAPSLWGGYAQQQYISSDSPLLPVDKNMDAAVATLFNPLGAGIQWAVKTPELRTGDVVAILGPGIRGLSCAAAAKSAGAGFVMITGVGPNDDERLSLAPRFGVDLAVDVNEENPIAALKQAVGQLADIAIDVTARAPSAFAQSIQMARPGGTVVITGTRGSGGTPGFWPDMIVFKEIRILGVLGVETSAYREALALLSSNTYPFDELPRRTAGFDELEGLIHVMSGQTDTHPPVHGVFVP